MTLSSPPTPVPDSPLKRHRQDTQRRRGLISLADAGDLLSLGARHGALRSVLARAEEAGKKKGRTMYAETARERALLLEAIRECRWNEERCPVSLVAHIGAGDTGGVGEGEGGDAQAGGAIVHDFGNG